MPISLNILSKFDAKGISQATSGLDRLGKVAGGFGLAAGAAFAVAAAGAVAFVVASGKQLMEIEKLNAQTNAAIKSTGAAAGRTIEQINGLNSSLEKLTGIEAEVIQQGQNMLLTFTNIKGDAFDEATKAALDLSVALSKDMQSAALLVGKALNDPIAGLGALSKAGVQFTDDQRAMITEMVEFGDVAGAQSVILAELNKQFGGSAEAFGETTAGKLAKIEHLFGELGETIAGALLPVLDDALPVIQDVVESFMTSPEFLTFVDDAADSFTELLEYLPDALDFLTKLAQDALPVLNQLLPTFNNLVKIASGNMGGLATSSDSAFKNLEAVAGIIKGITDLGVGLSKFLDDFAKSLGGFSGAFKGIIDAILAALFPVETGLQRIWQLMQLITGQKITVPNFTPSGYANPAFRNIPRMAEGGIVMPSLGGSIVNVAEAGQAEAIIPLDRLGKMGGGTTNNYNISVSAMNADARVGELIVSAIKKYERTSGSVFVSA
jgi:hypothetical protein